MNEYLTRIGCETHIDVKCLGTIMRNAFGDALRTKRKREAQTPTGDGGLYYAYVGLERTHDECAIEGAIREPVAAIPFDGDLWGTVRSHADEELNALCTSHGLFAGSGSFTDLLRDYSLSSLLLEISAKCPNVSQFISSIGSSSDDCHESTLASSPKTLGVLAILGRKCDSRVRGIQMLLSFMLLSYAANKHIFTLLNHIGLCVSYSQSLDILQNLASERERMFRAHPGRFMLVYDNVNFQKKVRHERKLRHTESWDFTSRLSVSIRNMPPEEVLALGNGPQASRRSLLPEDILPSSEDEKTFSDRAVVHVMRCLSLYFDFFEDVDFKDEREKRPTSKSTIYSLALMDVDEGTIDNNVEILTQSAKDLGWTGERPEVIVGDQKTCSNIRGAKRRRICDYDAFERLEWVNEVPGDFHFMWECLRVIFLLFWNRSDRVGSLSHIKHLLNRGNVSADCKNFQACDEFIEDVVDGFLCSSLSNCLESDEEVQKHPKPYSFETMNEVATAFVCRVVSIPRNGDAGECDSEYSDHRSLLHAGLLYRDLRHAVRYEDGPAIIMHWKWWLPYFLATARKNYSREAANMLANLKSNFSAAVAFVVTHNRTVNVSGMAGKGKAIDQAIEHHNLILKSALRSSGANASEKHLRNISLAAQDLQEAASLCKSTFQCSKVPQRHNICDSKGDVTEIVTCLNEKSVTKVNPERNGERYFAPYSKGLAKAVGDQWLIKYLRETTTIRDIAHEDSC